MSRLTDANTAYLDLEKKQAAEKSTVYRVEQNGGLTDLGGNVDFGQVGPKLTYRELSEPRAAYDTENCQSSPVGQAVAGKQHLLSELEERRKYYADQITRNYAEAHRLAETIQRLTTAINILTLNPNFAEFCELLGLKVPDVR